MLDGGVHNAGIQRDSDQSNDAEQQGGQNEHRRWTTSVEHQVQLKNAKKCEFGFQRHLSIYRSGAVVVVQQEEGHVRVRTYIPAAHDWVFI